MDHIFNRGNSMRSIIIIDDPTDATTQALLAVVSAGVTTQGGQWQLLRAGQVRFGQVRQMQHMPFGTNSAQTPIAQIHIIPLGSINANTDLQRYFLANTLLICPAAHQATVTARIAQPPQQLLVVDPTALMAQTSQVMAATPSHNISHGRRLFGSAELAVAVRPMNLSPLDVFRINSIATLHFNAVHNANSRIGHIPYRLWYLIGAFLFDCCSLFDDFIDTYEDRHDSLEQSFAQRPSHNDAAATAASLTTGQMYAAMRQMIGRRRQNAHPAAATTGTAAAAVTNVTTIVVRVPETKKMCCGSCC